jgi:hypothetical protein
MISTTNSYYKKILYSHIDHLHVLTYKSIKCFSFSLCVNIRAKKLYTLYQGTESPNLYVVHKNKSVNYLKYKNVHLIDHILHIKIYL